ncbi:hypothetical protein GCM10022224_079230 [Nonomuraea antimicrobica]|uniref:Uncharacterized protein n=1 Tax=Nonomuraea antimicrobica TaxID=561173 RepID=A0ABP7D6D7_9ACTN
MSAALATTTPLTPARADHPSHLLPGSRAAGLAMAFKLIEFVQRRWRAVNGAHLVALDRAGALFIDGKLVERPAESPVPTAAQEFMIHRS